jgi:hypothetical protein
MFDLNSAVLVLIFFLLLVGNCYLLGFYEKLLAFLLSILSQRVCFLVFYGFLVFDDGFFGDMEKCAIFVEVGREIDAEFIDVAFGGG